MPELPLKLPIYTPALLAIWRLSSSRPRPDVLIATSFSNVSTWLILDGFNMILALATGQLIVVG